MRMFLDVFVEIDVGFRARFLVVRMKKLLINAHILCSFRRFEPAITIVGSITGRSLIALGWGRNFSVGARRVCGRLGWSRRQSKLVMACFVIMRRCWFFWYCYCLNTLSSTHFSTSS